MDVPFSGLGIPFKSNSFSREAAAYGRRYFITTTLIGRNFFDTITKEAMLNQHLA